MKTIAIALLLIAAAHSAEPVDPRLSKLQETLAPIVEAAFPGSTFTVKGQSLRVSAKTMTFTLHATDKTGRISTETHAQEGPKEDGFILSATVSESAYEGAAVRPQTLREPYWSTYLGLLKSGTGHVTVNFSYGARTPNAFVSKIISCFQEH